MAFGFAATSAPQPQGTSASSFKSHQELKTALHRDLLNKIDLEKLTSLQDVRARTQVQNVILDLIGAANLPRGVARGLRTGTPRTAPARCVHYRHFGQHPPPGLHRAWRNTRTYQRGF